MHISINCHRSTPLLPMVLGSNWLISCLGAIACSYECTSKFSGDKIAPGKDLKREWYFMQPRRSLVPWDTVIIDIFCVIHRLTLSDEPYEGSGAQAGWKTGFSTITSSTILRLGGRRIPTHHLLGLGNYTYNHAARSRMHPTTYLFAFSVAALN